MRRAGAGDSFSAMGRWLLINRLSLGVGVASTVAFTLWSWISPAPTPDFQSGRVYLMANAGEPLYLSWEQVALMWLCVAAIGVAVISGFMVRLWGSKADRRELDET